MIGPGRASPEEKAAARIVGQVLGRAGAVLVCGGAGGVMEAACRGARETGATTVGFLSGVDRTRANEHITIALPTGLGEMRNLLVVRAADAVVAVGGEYGTLSEVALALKMGIPVVGLNTWELVRRGVTDGGIDVASDAETAAGRALDLARDRSSSRGSR